MDKWKFNIRRRLEDGKKQNPDYWQALKKRWTELGLCSRCGHDKKGFVTCKSCRKSAKERRPKYRKVDNLRAKNKHREKYINSLVNGKPVRIKANKRAYPIDKKCELCGTERFLVYHHWDNDNPSLGIWICTLCHVVVGYVEKGTLTQVVEKYLMIKNPRG